MGFAVVQRIVGFLIVVSAWMMVALVGAVLFVLLTSPQLSFVDAVFESMSGLDAETAYSAVAACITNLGPALGQAGPHYAELSDTAKVVLCAAMLLGRLEVYTLLVLLSPAFWRG